MATHTDNRHYGTIIQGSELDIGTINVVDGINDNAIYSILPKPYDLSVQLDGIATSFDLPQPYAEGTLDFFALFLNGDLLPRAVNAEDTTGDYYIEGNKTTIQLRGTQPAPPSTAVLIAVYVQQSLT